MEDIPPPKCPVGGAVIEVEACSICASDVKMVKVGHRDLSYPRVLGHEVAGKIVESRTDLIEVGSRAQIWPGMACGSCPPCQKGEDNQCDTIGILGFNMDGGLAELMAVPRGCVERGGVNRLSEGISFDVASLTEPLACCVNAQHAANVGPEDTVVVLGGGPLGAFNLMLAMHRQAKGTILIEKDPFRCRLIEENVHPDEVMEPSSSIGGMIKDATNGRGADVIILATSDPLPITDIIGALAKRGRLSIFSGLRKDAPGASIDLNQLHYFERSVIGSYGCRSQDCREALSLLSSRAVSADWLITKRVPLTSIVEALRHAEDRKGMKATVVKQG